MQVTVSNPAVFDGYVLTLNITHVRKTAAERSIEAHGNRLPQAAEIANHRHRRLLRARRERPRRCAADECDERAAVHSITSSARASSIGGTWRPIVLAAFRLITSSNFTGT